MKIIWMLKETGMAKKCSLWKSGMPSRCGVGMLNVIRVQSAEFKSWVIRSCDLDPISTTLLKNCKIALLPTITNIINFSLSTGNCSVHPKPKKHNLDYQTTDPYLIFLSFPNWRTPCEKQTHWMNISILEESVTSLEDKLSRDFRYLKVNIGCKLPIK